MDVRRPIEVISVGFEATGNFVMVLGAMLTSITSAAVLICRGVGSEVYQEVRQGLSQAILLGLGFLVAADIMQSIALDPTFASVRILRLLAPSRTYPSWSFAGEIEGQWPWRRSHSSRQESGHICG